MMDLGFSVEEVMVASMCFRSKSKFGGHHQFLAERAIILARKGFSTCFDDKMDFKKANTFEDITLPQTITSSLIGAIRQINFDLIPKSQNRATKSYELQTRATNRH
jgi:hypothetical protein